MEIAAVMGGYYWMGFLGGLLLTMYQIHGLLWGQYRGGHGRVLLDGVLGRAAAHDVSNPRSPLGPVRGAVVARDALARPEARRGLDAGQSYPARRGEGELQLLREHAHDPPQLSPGSGLPRRLPLLLRLLAGRYGLRREAAGLRTDAGHDLAERRGSIRALCRGVDLQLLGSPGDVLRSGRAVDPE